MATNIIHEQGDQLRVVCTAPTTPESGDPVLVGQLPGVALTGEDSEGYTTVKFNGVAELQVKGVDGNGNSAVAAGDLIYYVSGDTPVLSKKNSGVRFGYALGTVTSGETGTIRVKIGY